MIKIFIIMVLLKKYDNFRKSNILFYRELDKIFNKYNLDFISLKSAKIPFIIINQIVFNLFKNNSMNLKISDVIILTLSSISILAKENQEVHVKLFNIIKEKNLTKYYNIVKDTIKSIKNLYNIVLKNDDIVIMNIEQVLKYRYSSTISNLLLKYIIRNEVTIKDFSNWYKNDIVNAESKKLIEYIILNYY